MESAVRISVPVRVTILIITAVFPALGGWSLSAKTYMEQESKQVENTQLHINQMLLEYSFSQIFTQNQRIPQGSSHQVREHVRAIDYMDSDISEKLELCGQVNLMKRGVYTVRCVVRSSLGMKSVKHIQVLVDQGGIMKISITSALSMIFLTSACVLFINAMSVQVQITKLNDFHYGIVHELENSDLSPVVIDQLTHVVNYDVRIENGGVKDDLRIYQVITFGSVCMSPFRYEKIYTKESSAH